MINGITRKETGYTAWYGTSPKNKNNPSPVMAIKMAIPSIVAFILNLGSGFPSQIKRTGVNIKTPCAERSQRSPHIIGKDSMGLILRKYIPIMLIAAEINGPMIIPNAINEKTDW